MLPKKDPQSHPLYHLLTSKARAEKNVKDPKELNSLQNYPFLDKPRIIAFCSQLVSGKSLPDVLKEFDFNVNYNAAIFAEFQHISLKNGLALDILLIQFLFQIMALGIQDPNCITDQMFILALDSLNTVVRYKDYIRETAYLFTTMCNNVFKNSSYKWSQEASTLFLIHIQTNYALTQDDFDVLLSFCKLKPNLYLNEVLKFINDKLPIMRSQNISDLMIVYNQELKLLNKTALEIFWALLTRLSASTVKICIGTIVESFLAKAASYGVPEFSPQIYPKVNVDAIPLKSPLFQITPSKTQHFAKGLHKLPNLTQYKEYWPFLVDKDFVTLLNYLISNLNSADQMVVDEFFTKLGQKAIEKMGPIFYPKFSLFIYMLKQKSDSILKVTPFIFNDTIFSKYNTIFSSNTLLECLAWFRIEVLKLMLKASIDKVCLFVESLRDKHLLHAEIIIRILMLQNLDEIQKIITKETVYSSFEVLLSLQHSLKDNEPEILDAMNAVLVFINSITSNKVCCDKFFTLLSPSYVRGIINTTPYYFFSFVFNEDFQFYFNIKIHSSLCELSNEVLDKIIPALKTALDSCLQVNDIKYTEIGILFFNQCLKVVEVNNRFAELISADIITKFIKIMERKPSNSLLYDFFFLVAICSFISPNVSFSMDDEKTLKRIVKVLQFKDLRPFFTLINRTTCAPIPLSQIMIRCPQFLRLPFTVFGETELFNEIIETIKKAVLDSHFNTRMICKSEIDLYIADALSHEDNIVNMTGLESKAIFKDYEAPWDIFEAILKNGPNSGVLTNVVQYISKETTQKANDIRLRLLSVMEYSDTIPGPIFSLNGKDVIAQVDNFLLSDLQEYTISFWMKIDIKVIQYLIDPLCIIKMTDIEGRSLYIQIINQSIELVFQDMENRTRVALLQSIATAGHGWKHYTVSFEPEPKPAVYTIRDKELAKKSDFLIPDFKGKTVTLTIGGKLDDFPNLTPVDIGLLKIYNRKISATESNEDIFRATFPKPGEVFRTDQLKQFNENQRVHMISECLAESSLKTIVFQLFNNSNVPPFVLHQTFSIFVHSSWASEHTAYDVQIAEILRSLLIKGDFKVDIEFLDIFMSILYSAEGKIDESAWLRDVIGNAFIFEKYPKDIRAKVLRLWKGPVCRIANVLCEKGIYSHMRTAAMQLIALFDQERYETGFDIDDFYDFSTFLSRLAIPAGASEDIQTLLMCALLSRMEHVCLAFLDALHCAAPWILSVVGESFFADFVYAILKRKEKSVIVSSIVLSSEVLGGLLHRHALAIAAGFILRQDCEKIIEELCTYTQSQGNLFSVLTCAAWLLCSDSKFNKICETVSAAIANCGPSTQGRSWYLFPILLGSVAPQAYGPFYSVFLSERAPMDSPNITRVLQLIETLFSRERIKQYDFASALIRIVSRGSASTNLKEALFLIATSDFIQPVTSTGLSEVMYEQFIAEKGQKFHDKEHKELDVTRNDYNPKPVKTIDDLREFEKTLVTTQPNYIFDYWDLGRTIPLFAGDELLDKVTSIRHAMREKSAAKYSKSWEHIPAVMEERKNYAKLLRESISKMISEVIKQLDYANQDSLCLPSMALITEEIQSLVTINS